MPPPARLFPGDEELGKRDDDHRPRGKSSLGIARRMHQVLYAPHRRTVRRVALAIIAVTALYYFFRNMPTDLQNPRLRPHYDRSGIQSPTGSSPKAARPVNQGSTSSSERESPTEQEQHYFNGPIKFYELAASLQLASRRPDQEMPSKNVLFAAASLKSASVLLPIACEMSIRGMNQVHFALLGRDDISMDILKSVNGITKECKITYHGMPATFIDVSGEEDLYLLTGLKDRAKSLGRTIIELPENAEQSLMWTTLLDSASLNAWNKVSINMLVHAPLSSSGSLIRLLESLKNADFFSSAPPKLTIELPHDIDESTSRYLESFRWPPNSGHNAGNLLTLHHRIPQHGLTAEENSIRFLEAFWPADPESSHVLILSPQVELSPLFYHYLKYTMLEYKYSASNKDTHQNLLSISLDLPSTYINDTTEFEPPSPVGSKEADTTQFLWQAPNSKAALYFGDKWVELHDFIAHTLKSQHTLPTPTLNEKLVSKSYPSWLEHILKLSRARGYWTLYPNFKDADAIATIHNELYQLPEEYSHDPEIAIPDSSSLLTADPAHPLKHTEAPLISKSLLNALPSSGDLPRMIDLPLLGWDGERIKVAEIEEKAATYSRIFRQEVGGCEVAAAEKKRIGLTAGDLFCLEDKQE
ncbi:hypothetical protein OIDMADRAFT_199656 [Oidiodendron maius Zn]|uniref:Uncharacterized protein n=1 Tax=Oidiodendron maius (strain Zn) TaxID=913774 RepID=A0A0C3HAQ4_OIDMZ|nr:hypothetical protein OIDMADRAFT_199656 [Oidiodendron maius Zn]